LESSSSLRKVVQEGNTSHSYQNISILELVHSDVCGSMLVASITGSMYYVSFIDDFSCKTWIYFLKTKDEVFSRFEEFKALVEYQIEKGGEYTSKEFRGFCKEARIKREMTVTYNPQWNGVAKQKNRSIIGAAKAIIHDRDLPMFLEA
jgi:hypothetical protein